MTGAGYAVLGECIREKRTLPAVGERLSAGAVKPSRDRVARWLREAKNEAVNGGGKAGGKSDGASEKNEPSRKPEAKKAQPK